MLSGLCTIRFALGFRQRLCSWEKSLHLPFTRTPYETSPSRCFAAHWPCSF